MIHRTYLALVNPIPLQPLGLYKRLGLVLAPKAALRHAALVIMAPAARLPLKRLLAYM